MAKIWTIALLGAITVTRIGQGLYAGISGPTILYLADNVNTSVYVVSYMFMTKSVGILLGAVLAGIIKWRASKDFRHLLTLGLAIAVMGSVEMLIPWMKSLWLLFPATLAGGLMYGYLDAGLQAVILEVWGEKGSRSHIQLYHFAFSVGAFLAPIVARPFLVMADREVSASKRCPDDGLPVSNWTTMSPVIFTDAEAKFEGYNPVGYAYNVTALWMIFAGVLVVILALLRTETRVSTLMKRKGFSPEERPEEPLRDLIWIFLPLIGFYFCTVATENTFFNYIYSVSLCSDLRFSVTLAAYINSLNWLGIGLGRLSGIFVSLYFTPKTIIIWSIAGSTLDSIIMCLFGDQNAWVAWAVSFAHGFTTAMLFPSGVSWVSQYTNVSGLYMFIFSIGSATGVLAMLPLAGYIFDKNPFSVMYVVFVLAAANILFYSLALLAGRKHKRYIKKNETSGRKYLKTGQDVRSNENSEMAELNI